MTEKRKAGRPSKSDSRRTEILEKAAECFSHNGYNKTTLDQIGDALGFNKAALYYYFKDKEDLFSSVLKAGMMKAWEDVKSETLAADGFENKIQRYFDVKMNKWMVLLSINGISKENLINLNLAFAETISFYRNKEIEFLKAIFTKENNGYSESQTEDFINMLIDAQTDLTMHALLLDEVIKDVKKLEELKKIKKIFLLRMLKSFHTAYIPLY